jgi:hypothetical protein
MKRITKIHEISSVERVNEMISQTGRYALYDRLHTPAGLIFLITEYSTLIPSSEDELAPGCDLSIPQENALSQVALTDHRNQQPNEQL